MSVSVFIQTCPGREKSLAETLASVEASDIAEYTVLMHPEGKSLNEFFCSVLERMAACKMPYVLRLEDDVLVNKYILRNIATWPALKHPEFGAGWVFVPQGEVGPSWFANHRMHKNEMYRSKLPLHASVGYMFETKTLPRIIGAMREIEKEYESTLMDLGLSVAVGMLGLRVYLHMPSLVEHRIDVQSVMGHRHDAQSATAGGLFKLEWRRA